MDETVNAILSGDSAINDAVDGRIAPLKRDDKLPAITFERTGTEQGLTVGGTATSMKRSDYNIVVRAKSADVAKRIAKLVEARLSGLRGTYANQAIKLTQINNSSDEQLLNPDITEITIDVSFRHKAQ